MSDKLDWTSPSEKSLKEDARLVKDWEDRIAKGEITWDDDIDDWEQFLLAKQIRAIWGRIEKFYFGGKKH